MTDNTGDEPDHGTEQTLEPALKPPGARNDESLPKFRLGLKHLFYATAVISAGLALEASTIALSVVVLICWLLVFRIENDSIAVQQAFTFLITCA